MKRSERGFTLVEIMIVVAIIALLAAIAIPNVLRGRTTANESASVGNLRALMSSLEMYRSVYSFYPAAWNTMWSGITPPFAPPSFAVNLDAAQTVQGYAYTYAPGVGGNTYSINANPTVAGSTGTRTFWVNETGQVYHCNGDSTTQTPGTALTVDQAPATCP